MTLTAAKVGGWSIGEILTSDQVDHMDAEIVKAVDGTDGGTYNPSANLIFGGAGEVRINNVLRILTGADFIVDSGGTATFNELATFNDGALFDSDADFREDNVFRAGGSSEFEIGHVVTFDSLEDLKVDDEAVTMQIPQLWGVPHDDQATFQPSWQFTGSGWLANTNDASTLLLFPLPVMLGDDILAVEVFVTGGAHGADPAVKLTVDIQEADANGQFVGTLTSLVDPATGATYNGAHSIRLENATTGGVLPYPALNRQYILTVTGESGANSGPVKNLVRKVVVEMVRRQLVSTTIFGS